VKPAEKIERVVALEEPDMVPIQLRIQHKLIYYFGNSGTIGFRGYIAPDAKD
jgi:hypothetical protein